MRNGRSTVYTTAVLVGVALADRSYPPAIAALLALPAVLLVAAYALATWATLPIAVRFDPRVPEDIKRAHDDAVTSKQRRLGLAAACTLTAGFAVVAAVVAATITTPAAPPALHAAHATREGRDTILLRGQFPPRQEVTVTVTPDRNAAPGSTPVSVLEVASADGTFHASVPSRGKADTYQVQAAWGTDDAHWTLTTTVSVQPSPSTP